MISTPNSPVDRGLAGLLRLLLQQFQAGDDAGLQATLDEVGAARLAAAETITGALCLGGTDFAARLAASGGRETLTQTGRYVVVLDAFNAIVAAPPGASEDHETQVAERLIEHFGLQANSRTLLDAVRAEFLITAGTPQDAVQAAHAAIKHGQWELALRGFVRCRQAMQERTPCDVYGMAAICLHKLQRYDDADRWVEQGLGDKRALLHIGAVHSEAELLRRWSGQTSPVVSIVCTTYNHERYIDSAIRGFLSQDCSFAFEILIHDDASTDRTQHIVRRWQQQYPSVIRTVFQTENQFSKGVRPFELLLAQARGAFVATCEGDDFWIDSSKLQRQIDFLSANPEFSCSAHNYYHFVESTLHLKAWNRRRGDHVLSQRQLMGLHRLLWLPTLVFRKSFSVMPPQRALAPIGDQFLTSYLGTQGPCMYFSDVLGAVRRENAFSTWSPLIEAEKERIRVKTWTALICMHEALGNREAVADLRAKVSASPQAGTGDVALSADAATPASSVLVKA